MASSSNPTPMIINWSATETEKFIALMVDNVRNGQKTTTTFTKIGWSNIKAGLETDFQCSFIKDQLRNKMYKLRGDYDSFKKLLETTGFGWDYQTRTATAEDSIWERAIHANPTWSKFRRSGLPWWPELEEIFSEHHTWRDKGMSNITVNIPPRVINEHEDVFPQTQIESLRYVGLDDIEETDGEEEVTPTVNKRGT
ncbi:L10-interacting MYB domain-containing protein-like [Telopea speciosissima]|uniref:L10-interacting MYB domain-containing protein-like n=1 Tax=Telopea speciosissima TaxID=54955 RepID=UPI001CC69737|nr:L10-interacting MYB domain-containing protein-like [Telopea speciosissima]